MIRQNKANSKLEMIHFSTMRELLLMVNIHASLLLDQLAIFHRKKNIFNEFYDLKHGVFIWKTPKNSEKVHFFCSRPNMAVFQIFQDRFFDGLLFSIREGLVKALLVVPSLFAAEIDPSGS